MSDSLKSACLLKRHKMGMAYVTVLAILALLAISQTNVEGKATVKNAHDLIMEANRDILTKRSVKVKSGSAEDAIVKINEALGDDLFEGDIQMSKSEIKQHYEGSNKRNFMMDMRFSWRSRTIPYIVTQPDYGATSKIREAMNDIEKKVPCLKFRPRQSSDTAYIDFYKGVGCFSPIGKRIPSTKVSLGANCLSKGLIIHEILHALGFYHEQSRPDRDSFVTINYENIQSGQEYNFKRLKAHESKTQDTMYDYKSILHYSRTSFTANGRDTMIAKFDPSMDLGSQELSELDILELNKIYQCHLSSSTIWSSWTSWTGCYSYGSECRETRQQYCMSENAASCTGADSYGVKDEHRACSSCLEPMNGHWGKWGSWGSCSKACDMGVYTRHRSCNNPRPSNGGKGCKGLGSETTSCRIKNCNQKWYDTSFEDGWGMWKQGYGDQLDWTRYTGATHTTNTGPDGDHTTHFGYYVYVESGAMNNGRTAMLQSSELPANFGQKCLRFYYSMNGKNMGSLKAELKFKSGSTMWLWEKKGHQGTGWHAAATGIPASSQPYQIIFQATIGFSPYSDIALDDIYIDAGSCVCKDKQTNCAQWAKQGECYTNAAWMTANCCKSCSALGSCTDSYGSQCVNFAKNYGCSNNKAWMWPNCCKSCKDCLDRNAQCKFWAGNGECEKNSAWMRENCKISCKVCVA